MGTPTQYYVSPASGNDTTGNGTIGTPWATVQKALNTITRDSTNGDQINVQAGGTDTLSAALSWATYGTPTDTAPCIIRGYTSAANDGGVGVISGGGSVAIINSGSLSHVYLIDIRGHSCGSAAIITLGTSTFINNCQFDTSTGAGVVISHQSHIQHCYIYNCGGIGISVSRHCRIVGNFLKNGTNKFTAAIQFGDESDVAEFNIISIDSSSDGINVASLDSHQVRNNSIYSNGGTGQGIDISNQRHTIVNNIVEGFSGSGGIGIRVNSGADVYLYGHNKFYNNATHETLTGDIFNNLGNNDTLGASPFTNPAGDDFSVSTAVKAGAYPSSFKGSSTNQYLDVGAAQRQEPAGGGGSGRRSRIRGHGI